MPRLAVVGSHSAVIRRLFTANSEETGSLPARWSAKVTTVTATASR